MDKTQSETANNRSFWQETAPDFIFLFQGSLTFSVKHKGSAPRKFSDPSVVGDATILNYISCSGYHHNHQHHNHHLVIRNKTLSLNHIL
jgi:hypothetical protein